MPIKGLTEVCRFSRAGKLRLGEKRQSKGGAEYPAKLDYFRADFADERLQEEFRKLYGDKPSRVMIAFPSEDEDEIFPQYYKLYGAGAKLKCKGDGETCTRFTAVTPQEMPCPGPDNCDFCGYHGTGEQRRPNCGRVATLRFFLLDLPTLQLVEINTGSYNSIMNVNAGIRLLKTLARRCSFIPVALDLRPEMVTHKGQSSKAYILHLDIPVGLRNVKGALQPLLDAPDEPAALPAPDDECPDDLVAASIVAGYGVSGDPQPDPPAEPLRRTRGRRPVMPPSTAPTSAVETVDPETGEVVEPGVADSATPAAPAPRPQQQTNKEFAL